VALHIITAGLSVAHLKLKNHPLDFMQAHSITRHVTVSLKNDRFRDNERVPKKVDPGFALNPSKEVKILVLIKRPGNPEALDVQPITGSDPVADGRTAVPRMDVPGAAAQNADARGASFASASRRWNRRWAALLRRIGWQCAVLTELTLEFNPSSHLKNVRFEARYWLHLKCTSRAEPAISKVHVKNCVS
jgi:hypothetical protein